MRLYFCDNNKCLTFNKSSEDYLNILKLSGKKDNILSDNIKVRLIEYLEKVIDHLYDEKSDFKKKLNKIERLYKKKRLLLGKNIIDIRLLSLIDFREFLLSSENLSVYFLTKLSRETKLLHLKLKNNNISIDELTLEEKTNLLDNNLIELRNDSFVLSEKGDRINFIL